MTSENIGGEELKHAHIGIRVRDMEKSLTFYRDILGGDLISQKKIPSAQLAFISYGGFCIELIMKQTYSFVHNGVIEHIAFEVENFEERIEKLRSLGVKFFMEEPMKFGETRIIFFEGPDGEHLELMEKI